MWLLHHVIFSSHFPNRIPPVFCAYDSIRISTAQTRRKYGLRFWSAAFYFVFLHKMVLVVCLSATVQACGLLPINFRKKVLL